MRTRERSGGPDVAASFADMQHARVAIEALENSGIDGDDIMILGDTAREAGRDTRQPEVDRRVATRLFWRVTKASLVWGAVGLAVGLAVGAVLLWVSGSWNAAAWLVVFAILGGFLGSTVAAMVGAERSISDSDAWEPTFHDAPAGTVWVGVRVADDHAARAAKALERANPISLRVDARDARSHDRDS